MQRLACALVLVAGLAAADRPRGSGLPVVSAKSRSARAATRGHGVAGAVSAVAPRAASTDALVARGGAEAPTLTYQLITVAYFAGWYALNVKYNLVNKARTSRPRVAVARFRASRRCFLTRAPPLPPRSRGARSAC